MNTLAHVPSGPKDILLQPQSRLFALPRELRDLVYEYYLMAADGYHYNHETGKLTQIGGQPIDIALTYTCKLATAEINGRALTLNAIKFTTAHDEGIRDRAGQYALIVQRLEALKSGILCAVYECIESSTSSEFEPEFSYLLPVISQLRTLGADHELVHKSWGETPSLHRRFVVRALEILSEHTNFSERITSDVNIGRFGDRVHEILSLDDSPWNTPDSNEIANMWRVLDDEPMFLEIWERTKHRFSAAATAIRFLSSLPKSTRCRIRRVLLDEDRVSVAWPECHAQGLIPFCQENGALRVERRVDLWRNALPGGAEPINCVASAARSHHPQDRMDRLRAGYITNPCLAPWIMEALALDGLGMPPQCFKLKLDGQPTPERSSEVFKVVQRDAAWQTAFERHFAEQHDTPSWFEMRDNGSYQMRGFPEAITAIVRGTSIVSCNFDTDTPEDPDTIAQDGRHWTMGEWEQQWRMHEPRAFNTAVPLPGWESLRLSEEALPE
ncbi:hypothetical protein J4E83_007138 [Alternaria metachromatica]|uniref:uncharacterized protein n=1 Tax=Alternaria metachromatica TaxID=283354 RepID=UPI0020C1B9EE|nr:uncharacterized protein J4E83_007138 [Alternaria metachromatica]KAI4614484.1 hypothetical protein J4E83_007138 [Alternaria metachromatica]